MKRRDFILKLMAITAVCALVLPAVVTVEHAVPHLQFSAAQARNGNSGNHSGGASGSNSGGASGGTSGGSQGAEGADGSGNGGAGTSGSPNRGSADDGAAADSRQSSSEDDGPQTGSGDSGWGLSSGTNSSLSSDRAARATTISIRHANGTIERIVDGRYEMRDSRSRTIVNRRATAADRSRLEELRR
jgi:hypothetical protein